MDTAHDIPSCHFTEGQSWPSPVRLAGRRWHHGMAGIQIAALGLAVGGALVLHDWLVFGDSPRICVRDWFRDRT